MTRLIGCAVLAFAAAAALQAGAAPVAKMDRQSLAHGRKLVNIGGCNDCHTPGWGEHGGHAPKNELLVGGGLAFQGPWGTTYPINLRLFVQSMNVAQWIQTVRNSKARPLMPWWTFRYMSDYDIASIYYYIRSLGPAGKPAHAWVPPGETAPPPYLKLVVPPPPGDAAGKH